MEAAVDSYKKAIELAPNQDQLHLLKNLSVIQLELEEYEKVFENCEQTIQQGIKDGEIYFIQGCCLFEMNKFEQAIEKYSLAIEAGYEDTKVYVNRAKAYFCLNKFDNAYEDASNVLIEEPSNLECFKIRGLIALSKDQYEEAYSDFYMAIHKNADDLFIEENQSAYLRVALNLKRISPQQNIIRPLLNSPCIFKPCSQSRLAFNGKAFKEELYQIDFHSFGQGLAFGLYDGGIETLKELGPFLINLLFHPIETTEELLIGIRFLFSKALEEDWETVLEVLVPEMKELFSTWNKIEDYHKGRLTGLFIGKNGMAALTALGAVKTCSKLKHAVIGSNKSKLSCLLKQTKPEIETFLFSESSLPTASKDTRWHLPCQGGAIIETKFYNEPTLGRMAPDLKQNKAILEAKACKKCQELGFSFSTWEEFENWTLSEAGTICTTDSKIIPPPVLKVEISNTGLTGRKIEVSLNEKNDIINVNLLQKNETIVQDSVKKSSILIKEKNVINHVMQEHHHWEKVIEITGNLEEDFKKVLMFIESNAVVCDTNLISVFKHQAKPIRVNEYVKNINGYEIHIFMENYIEKCEIFLKNAYVETCK